jgi:hypothetical protein
MKRKLEVYLFHLPLSSQEVLVKKWGRSSFMATSALGQTSVPTQTEPQIRLGLAGSHHRTWIRLSSDPTVPGSQADWPSPQYQIHLRATGPCRPPSLFLLGNGSQCLCRQRKPMPIILVIASQLPTTVGCLRALGRAVPPPKRCTRPSTWFSLK